MLFISAEQFFFNLTLDKTPSLCQYIKKQKGRKTCAWCKFMLKYRSRVFMLVLYPDCESHVDALNKISLSYDYASILHDMDVDEDGVLKKPHYHVVIRTQNAIWNTALASDIGLESNYVQKARNFENAMLYLIHYNDSDKYQYEPSQVNGTLAKKINEIIGKGSATECEKVLLIIQYIEESEQLTVRILSNWIAQNGMWDVFRRSATIILKILDEHNKGI